VPRLEILVLQGEEDVKRKYEEPRGRAAEVSAAKALLEQYDAVAASGQPPEPRVDESEGFNLHPSVHSIVKQKR
jgi:hypothetical protein